MAWVLKYSHSREGTVREGTNIQDLMEAVKAGKPIRVVLDNEPNASVFDADRVWVNGGDVIAQNTNTVGVLTLDPPRFMYPNPYWYMVMISTDGHAHTIQMNTGSDTARGDIVHELSARWFAQE